MRNTQIIIIALLMLAMPVSSALTSSECTDVEALNYAKQVRCQLDTQTLAEIKIMADENSIALKEVFNATSGQQLTTGTAQGLFNFFYYIFWGFFVLGVIYTGYKFMTNSGRPAARNAAKKQLTNIFILGIAIVALPIIIKETNILSNSLSAQIYDTTIKEDYFKFNFLAPETGSGLEQNLERKGALESATSFFQLGAKSYLVSMNARNIILLALIALSPIILLLYFFIPTQAYGKMITALFFIEYFIPSVYMTIFSFSNAIAPGGDTLELEAHKLAMLSSALIFATIIHIAIIAVATFKSVISSKITEEEE